MKKLFSQFTSVLVTIAFLAVSAPFANAAGITGASDTMSSQKISTLSSHVITFDLPTALSAGADIVITFPAGFDLATEPATVSNMTPIGTDGITGQVVTYTVTSAQTAGETYTITIDDIENPAGATNYSIGIVADNGDEGEITVPILSDDQVIVTADVNQTLSFAVSDNSIGFGTLSSGSLNYATDDGNGSTTEPTNAHTLTAGTNATSGYTISVMGYTLTSGANSIDIIGDATTPTLGTEQFGLDVDNAGGGVAPTISAPFDDYGMTNAPTTPETLATVASPSADNVLDINYVANIATLTEAGAYSTTFTYTMSANF